MSCNQILTGIARDCADAMGGVLEVYACHRASIASKTVASGIITAITFGTGADKFHRYFFRPQTASMVSTLNKNSDNGSKYVGTDVTMRFSKYDTAKRLEMQALALSELVLIVKDANGKYWFVGDEHPVEASAGSTNLGTKFEDFNGSDITLHCDESHFPLEVAASVITNAIFS